MTEKRRFAVVFALGIMLGAGMTLYSAVFAENDTQTATSPLPLDDLRAFTEVFGKVKSYNECITGIVLNTRASCLCPS